MRYNDISPLENHHCAVAFQILAQPECNIFSNVQPDGFKQIRQVRGGERSTAERSGAWGEAADAATESPPAQWLRLLEDPVTAVPTGDPGAPTLLPAASKATWRPSTCTQGSTKSTHSRH